MTSQLTFSDIKHTLIKPASDVTKTERVSGKLYARSIVNRLGTKHRIDVLVLKSLPVIICGEPLIFNEADIRFGTRRCFEELSKAYKQTGKLQVNTNFFKKIKDGDTILVILHEL